MRQWGPSMVKRLKLYPFITLLIFLSSVHSQLALAEETTALHTAKIPVITVVAPDWDGFTSPNGEGLYWDILRAIYEPEGTKLKIATAPWNRAMKMVTKYRTYLAIPGEYRDTEENLIFPRYPLEKEKMVTVTLKSSGYNLTTLESLRGLKVSWRKDYDLLDPDESGIKLDEFRDIADGLREVMSKKVDALIDEPDEVDSGLQEAGLNKADFNIIPYSESQYVYLGFHPGIISERLIEIYNRRTEELVKSGEMAKIYGKWDAKMPEVFKDI